MRRPEQEGWQQLPQGQDQLWHGLSQPWAEAKIKKRKKKEISLQAGGPAALQNHGAHAGLQGQGQGQ